MPIFVIWRGRGIVVPLILGLDALLLFGLGALTQWAAGAVYVNIAVAAAVGGTVLWSVGRRLNDGSNDHTFFFVPVQWWGVPLWGIAALAAILEVVYAVTGGKA